MYNIVKTGHPRVMNFVGYVLNIGGVRVYHAGDIERIAEMRGFAADVAMLPLGQTFTMNTVQEAVDAAFDLKARIAIPIHWGNAECTLAEANFFVSQLSGRMQAMVNTPAEGFALEVSETISIAEQPVSQTVAPGTNATLSVQATGSGVLRNQWRRNGVALPAAIGATLPIPAATAANAGDYEVIVTDLNGPAVSRSARLMVETPRPGRLVNFSVRGTVRGPESPLVVGAFVAGGSNPLLVRAVGPALGAFGLSGAVPDPRLEVHTDVGGRDTIVASNNDWGAGGAAAALRATFAAVGAFELADAASRDAALLTAFEGSRTVQVFDAAGRSRVELCRHRRRRDDRGIRDQRQRAETPAHPRRGSAPDHGFPHRRRARRSQGGFVYQRRRSQHALRLERQLGGKRRPAGSRGLRDGRGVRFA